MVICCELRSTGTFVREDPVVCFMVGQPYLDPNPSPPSWQLSPADRNHFGLMRAAKGKILGKHFCFVFGKVMWGLVLLNTSISLQIAHVGQIGYPQISCILCMSHICFVSSPAISILNREIQKFFYQPDKTFIRSCIHCRFMSHTIFFLLRWNIRDFPQKSYCCGWKICPFKELFVFFG